MRLLKTKLITLLAFMLCMGVFCIPALASDGGEVLTVNAAWLDGDMLRINVTDADGVSSALALHLKDYVNDAENKEHISIQAVDLAGNKSGVIEIKNPYYDPSAAPIIVTPTPTETPQSSQSAVPNGSKPFTPDGTGTVMDSVTDGDGKEFFTIDTEDGSVFYLIVDRQRDTDNVYLLNAVTEEDLMALAQKNGKTINNSGGTSAIPSTEQQGSTEGQSQPPTTAAPDTETEPSAKNDTSMYIFVGIAVAAVGGAGYYFKIVKGKKNVSDDDDDDDDYGYDDGAEDDDLDDPEDGGDEE